MKSSDMQASIDASINSEYGAIRETFLKNFDHSFELVPQVMDALTLNYVVKETQAGPLTKKMGDRTLLVQTTDSRILPESLFRVTEENNICQDLSLDEGKCPHFLRMKLEGPIHSYQNVVEGRASPNLGGSYSVTFELRPQDRAKPASGTKFKMTLDLVNGKYIEFFRYLQQTGKIQAVPADRDIKGAFQLWAQRVAKDLIR